MPPDSGQPASFRDCKWPAAPPRPDRRDGIDDGFGRRPGPATRLRIRDRSSEWIPVLQGSDGKCSGRYPPSFPCCTGIHRRRLARWTTIERVPVRGFAIAEPVRTPKRACALHAEEPGRSVSRPSERRRAGMNPPGNGERHSLTISAPPIDQPKPVSSRAPAT